MNSRRVLVVEDERDIARLLALHLEDLGCEVDHELRRTHRLARALDGTRGVSLSWIFVFRARWA